MITMMLSNVMGFIYHSITLIPVLCFLSGYLLGSISSATVVCHFMNLPDPRSAGSGNPGATNVLRLGGKKLALVTLLFDMGKAFVPACLFNVWFTKDLTTHLVVYVVFGAFLGHIFPVYYKFKGGGKGVATFLGGLFALQWVLGLCFCILWLVCFILTRYSSLSSLIASSGCLIIAYVPLNAILGREREIVLTLMVIILILCHRSNLSRLLNGTETKLNFSKDKAYTQR